jgi:hypothetical protein
VDGRSILCPISLEIILQLSILFDKLGASLLRRRQILVQCFELSDSKSKPRFNFAPANTLCLRK